MTMSFDMAREMSGKSIASASSGDDRFDGTARRCWHAHRREECGCRRGTRPCCSRASAIASIRHALDRHRSRAAWFRKAGKPAVDIARQFVGDPAFADFLARFVRNPFQSRPFGRRSFNSIFGPFDWVVAQMMSVCSDRGYGNT